MFNNVALDIVIGLVFIYLLYSLFATSLSEGLAAWFGLRARVLRLAIERMLNDGYYEKLRKYGKYILLEKLWIVFAGWLRRFFYYEVEAFKYSFAGRFYNHPSIQYLSKGKKQGVSFVKSKPSYISSDNFADTLLQIFREKGAGDTDLERIYFTLRFNTLQIQAETLKHFRHLLSDSGADLAVFRTNLQKWFDETMDRTTGWYKRKVKLMLFILGLLIASTFNVDSIAIAKILSRDEAARDQLVKMAIEISKDSVRNKNLPQQINDSVIAKSVLDSTLALIKKDITQANVILGLGWEFDKLTRSTKYSIKGNQENKIQLLRDLNSRLRINEDSLKSQVITLAKNKLELDTIQKQKNKLVADTIAYRYSAFKDSSLKQGSVNFINDQKKLLDSFKLFEEFIRNKNQYDSGRLKIFSDSVEMIRHAVASFGNKNLVRIDSAVYDPVADKTWLYGLRPYNNFEKFGYVVTSVFTNGMRLLGIVMTALALTLGAPFWFDLLRKLVSIRSAGVKPEEKKPTESASALTTSLKELADQPKNRILPIPRGSISADIYEEAVKKYQSEIISIPGVKSIFKGVNNGQKCVQINVADNEAKELVTSKYSVLHVDQTKVIPYVVIAGPVKPRLGTAGKISNSSGQNGFGTISCVVQHSQTNVLHILSCWHVLKGNTSYDEEDAHTILVNHRDERLARRWAGGIHGKFDFGFAELLQGLALDNSALKQQLGMAQSANLVHAPVSDVDINTNIPVKFFNCISEPHTVKRGVIFTDAPGVEIDYPDKLRIVEDVLVLTENINDPNHTISEGGNSGSLVVTENNMAIGIVIGGDDKFTYAMKLSHVFKIFPEMNIV
jgi:hypothetical protein